MRQFLSILLTTTLLVAQSLEVDGDLHVTGDLQAANQISPFNWVGSLSEFEGGDGYWAKVTQPVTFIFTHPDGVIIVSPQLPNIRK